MELKEYEWKNDSRMLEGMIQLVGTFPLKMYLYTPTGYSFAKVEYAGATCSARQESDDILAVTFLADKTSDFLFKIKFE